LETPEPPIGPAKEVEWFEVKLDEPAKTRWNEVVIAKKEEVLFVLNSILDRVPKAILPLATKLLNTAEHFWPLEIREEMEGVADILSVPVGDVLITNLFYELNSGCTSIIAEHENGTIFHGRNLDYGVPGLQNITVNIRFTKESKTMYQGTTYVSFLGLLTGMKPNAFSLSIDERDTKNGTVWDNAFEAIFEGGHSIGFFFRETLQNAANFDNALNLIQVTHMDSPSYMIIGGVTSGQGAVVTRERNVAVDTWKLGSAIGSAGQSWFLVETNYDHWVAAPANDDRRDPANAHMNATNRSFFTDQTMYQVLSQFPNLNSHTTYTAVTSAFTGVYYAFTQNNE
jgi:N-acylethanolamine-hydrolysing acid amidase